MKKLLPLTFIGLMFAGILYGQNKKLLSMDDAVNAALENRTEYQVNKIQEQIAGKQTEVARFGKVPKIYGDYDLRRNLIIPTTPVPAKAFNPSAPEDELTPLQFSTKWTSGAGINASMYLFNPSLAGQIVESELQQDISETETKITENKLKYQVRSAYAASLIAHEQWRLSAADSMSKRQLLDIAILQHAGGRITDLELNTARNALTQARSNYLQAQKIFESSKIDLNSEMGLDPTEFGDVVLTDSIPLWINENGTLVETDNLDPDLKKITQQQALNRLQADNMRKTALPTVTLSGFLGVNYYENKFNIWKGENWYGNSYMKVGVHIPITEGMDRNKRIEVLDLQRKVLEQNYAAQSKEQRKEIMKIRQDLEYTRKSYELQEDRILRSQENYEKSMLQFDAGRVLVKDVIEYGFQYQQAKSDYLQALYDHMKAKIEWTRIVGFGLGL